MFSYSVEEFSETEKNILSAYVTDIDGPVFALTNLDESVKGALFARYSRSSKSLRRLFIDEFAGNIVPKDGADSNPGIGTGRAQVLYDRVFNEYGDDSVAQLGGVHLACEQVSNVLTKLLERGRIMSYLEQSTRYIPYDVRLTNSQYRYYRDPAVLESPLGVHYLAAMDFAFAQYSSLIPKIESFLTSKYPQAPDDPDPAYRRSIKAKALDLLRGLLPVATLSNVGIYGSGQAFEGLILRLRASALPEANAYAELMLQQLRMVIPSFLTRLDRPDRGGVWQTYLEETRERTRAITERIFENHALQVTLPATMTQVGSGDPTSRSNLRPGQYDLEGNEVRLIDFDSTGEDKVLQEILFEHSNLSMEDARSLLLQMSEDERAELMASYVGSRRDRRHKPGRAFEATQYVFEVVSDYGAFRDLQRHRLLTIEWQSITGELGFYMPGEIMEADLSAEYVQVVERERELHDMMSGDFPLQAQYALPLASRIRYVICMNAREAMHLIELRSMPQGHISYRKIAIRMFELIREVANHKLIAQSMQFVQTEGEGLGRMASEKKRL